MDLREVIENIVSSLSSAPNFKYGRRSELNFHGDKLPFPAVLLIEPDTGAFQHNAVTGNLRDSYDTFIQFVDQIKMGEDANFRHPTVQAQIQVAKEFIRALDRSDIFLDLNTQIPFVLVVDTYDVNVAGIEINLAKLTSLQPLLC